MDTQELENTIQQLTEQVGKISGNFETLNKNYNNLKALFEHHAHSGADSTLKIKYGLDIQQSEVSYFGNGGILEVNDPALPTIDTFFIASGKDRGLPAGNTQSTGNSTIQLQNQTTDSFFYGVGHSWQNSPFTVTAGGNTLTDATFSWTVNALAGMYVNIFTAARVLVETQKVASNTASVITIVGTWINTTTGGMYEVFTPCYLGAAQHPWRRVYTGEGTGEGIRFGYGTTNGGQNGLAYMDATGDLYWRDKAGTSTKLNSGGSSASARSYGSGVTTIANNTNTKLTLNANSFASGVTWNSGSNRFDIVTTGKYIVTAQVRYVAIAGATIYTTQVNVNGASFLTTSIPSNYVTANINIVGFDILSLAAGDYVELYTYQNSGGNQTVANSSETFLAIALV